jgi:hypothetical protein
MGLAVFADVHVGGWQREIKWGCCGNRSKISRGLKMGMTTALCTSDCASLTFPGLSFDDEGDVWTRDELSWRMLVAPVCMICCCCMPSSLVSCACLVQVVGQEPLMEAELLEMWLACAAMSISRRSFMIASAAESRMWQVRAAYSVLGYCEDQLAHTHTHTTREREREKERERDNDSLSLTLTGRRRRR